MPNFNGLWSSRQQMQARGENLWPAAPGAPTIGTATAGDAEASVSFTAPSDTGYPTNLTYTVTSSPGGITATGSSSPITVTGLTNYTSYTFTVTATNANGTSPASSASNSVMPAGVQLVVFYTGSGGTVLRSDTLANVTSTYIDSSASSVSWAASHERMYKPTHQNRYIGYGTWTVAGAVADTSTTPWTYYVGYSGISNPGGGSAFYIYATPNSYNAVAINSGSDEGVCNTTTKAEIGSYPASFNSYGNNSAFTVQDDYFYMWGTGGLYKYTFNSQYLSLSSSNASYTWGGLDDAVAASPDNTMIAGNNGSTLYIFNSSCSLTLTKTSWPITIQKITCMAFSPDSRYLLVGGRTSSQPFMFVLDSQNSFSATNLSVPAATATNNYIRGIAWYPDGDTYAVSGYANTRNHIGKVSSGGMTTNLYTGGQVTGSACGVAVIPM